MRFFDLIQASAGHTPDAVALVDSHRSVTYSELAQEARRVASGLREIGIGQNDRIAIYLNKRIEAIVAALAISLCRAIFVFCNPLLKGRQVRQILADCNARALVSSRGRFEALWHHGVGDPNLVRIIVDGGGKSDALEVVNWNDLAAADGACFYQAGPNAGVDSDVATIFYTSGSTGAPKGVVISHRNLVVGARSVAQYIGNTAEDRILALLPLGFDAGFSQLTTAFCVGARAILHDYISAADTVRMCDIHGVTGLTAVPHTFAQLLRAEWPERARKSLRYFANTGGHMPRALLGRLRACFPDAKPYLMYGLTEAFRSTYLDPSEVDRRPDSIGKAIPNAEILVVKPDGSLAGPGEEGELVHRGPLVGLGYWNDPERTAERYRPAPGALKEVPTTELAVWSGDIVRLDEEGFLYFIGRNDDMIKTGGVRVSPTEIEDVLHEVEGVLEAAVIPVADTELGARIVAAVVADSADAVMEKRLAAHCRRELPSYLVPSAFVFFGELPRSPNGKVDRRAIGARFNRSNDEGEAEGGKS